MKKILLVVVLIALMPTAATAYDTIVVVQQPTMAENLIAMELIWPTLKPPVITKTVITEENGEKVIITTTQEDPSFNRVGFPLRRGFRYIDN